MRGSGVRPVAFVIGRGPVARMLRHRGEPSEPPNLAPVRAFPLWEEAVAPRLGCSSLAQPEPAYLRGW
jgi:hypothetical protein